METLPIDTILDIFNGLSFSDIEHLCLSNKNFNNVCKSPRVKDYIKQKFIDPYIQRSITFVK